MEILATILLTLLLVRGGGRVLAWYHRACSRGPGLLRYLVHSYILQVGARDAVHDLVVIVAFLSIKSQFVALEDHEMLLEGLSLCF